VLSEYRWRLVAGLAISQTIGYGVLFYAFSVFLIPTAHDLHPSTPVVTGALTSSLLAGTVAAVPVGRHLDRHGGRALMSAGSIVASMLVIAWSQVHNLWQLYIVGIGIGIGIASAAVPYEAAFAVVVSWFGAEGRARALLAVTIVAGFASSTFLPTAGFLTANLGRRDAVLVLAAIHAALTIPFHLLIRCPSQPSPKLSRDADGRRRDMVAVALRDPAFWMLGGSLLAQGAAVFVMELCWSRCCANSGIRRCSRPARPECSACSQPANAWPSPPRANAPRRPTSPPPCSQSRLPE
jgi:MFS family permease